jgi:hypothetical protein
MAIMAVQKKGSPVPIIVMRGKARISLEARLD